MPRPVLPCDSGLSRVQICMRDGLNQMKNGFLSRFAGSMKSVVAVRNSSSIVSMRFLVSGPVSSHLCLPQGPNVARRVGRGRDALQDAARTKLRPEGRVLRIVRMLGLVLGVEVVEVAE